MLIAAVVRLIVSLRDYCCMIWDADTLIDQHIPHLVWTNLDQLAAGFANNVQSTDNKALRSNAMGSAAVPRPAATASGPRPHVWRCGRPDAVQTRCTPARDVVQVLPVCGHSLGLRRRASSFSISTPVTTTEGPLVMYSLHCTIPCMLLMDAVHTDVYSADLGEEVDAGFAIHVQIAAK